MSSWEEECYPWLVYHHGAQRQNQTFCGFSSSNESSIKTKKSIPELSNKKVMFCSMDGCWLILLHAEENHQNEELSIWNPATLESIPLPKVRVSDRYTEDVVFEYIDKGQALFSSSSPDDPNCFIFLFLGVIPLLLYCRVGDHNWREFNYAQTIEAQKPSRPHHHQCCVFQRHNRHTCTQLLHQPVSVNGKIYALTSCSLDLVKVNVHDDEFNYNCSLSVSILTIVPQGPSLSLRRKGGAARKSYLVSWDDEFICRVDIFLNNSPDLKSRQAPEIKLFLFNFHTNTWGTIKKTLNGGLIFLGSRYSLACDWGSGDPNKWSGIYFTSDYNHKILFSYRIEDGTLTSYSPCPTTPYLQDEPPQWIMPFQEEDAQQLEEDVKQQQQQPVWSLPSSIAKCIYSFVVNTKSLLWNLNTPEQQQGKGKRKHVYDGTTMMSCSKKQRMMVDDHGSAGQGQGQSSFSDLSLDLLGLIAENHLDSFVSYIRFPFINKSCAASTIGISRKNPFHPCLIYTDKVSGVYHIADSNLSHRLSVKIPKVLKETKICGSRDGWILLNGCGSDSYSYSLFNPFTQQIVGTVGRRVGCSNHGLSNITVLGKPSPSSPENCSVLAMSLLSSEGDSQLQPGNPAEAGKAQWWRLVVGITNPAIEFTPSCNSPVLWRDCWYYLGHNGRLGLLHLTDMEERRFEWKVEAHSCPCQSYTRSYLSECGEDLVSVFIGDSDQEPWVRVFKLGDKEWEEIDSLQSNTLYLGWPSSMCCHAESLAMSDRIYFPRFYKDGLVYYSLKTRKHHFIGNDGQEDELKSFHGTTMYLDCAWIKPEIVG